MANTHKDQGVRAISSRGNLFPSDLGPTRASILSTAFDEIGVVEQPLGSNRGPRVDEYMPSWARGGAWCAGFVCWVLKHATGAVPTGTYRVGVHSLMQDAKDKRLWGPKAQYLPSPGDIFVMDMGRGTGHVGFLIGYSQNRIETIEGNSNDRVRSLVRDLSDPRIVGFINTVPDEPYGACWWTGYGSFVEHDGTR